MSDAALTFPFSLFPFLVIFMSVSYLAKVNQKLAFARALLSLVEQSEGQNLAAQALSEGVLFHLHNAFHCYLREIAESVGVVDTGEPSTFPPSLNHWASLLADNDKYSADISELLALQAKDDSWLNALFTLYKNTQVAENPTVSQSSQSSLGVINAVQIDTLQTQACTPNAVRWLYKALLELIERQREGMQEC